MQKRLTSIRAKFDELARLDSDCDLADSANHNYQLNPPLQLAQIEAFEAEYGVLLPAEYRAFLMKIGDGGAGPYDGLPRLNEAPRTALETPFPHRDFFDVSDDENLPDDAYGNQWIAGALTLSDQGCGMHDLLVISGAETGQMWQDDRSNGFGIFPLARNREELGESQEDVTPFTIAEKRKERLSFLDWYEWWLDWSLEEVKALKG